MRLLTIPGSLRQGSYNRALLRAVAECVPPGVEVVQGDLRGIPVFDEDRELDAEPPALMRLRADVRTADGVLIATPEYNQGMPGVLKNALDWLSRPAPDRVLDGKPVAVIGASTGPWGTRYAQQMTRHVLGATGCRVMTSPMLFVRQVEDVVEDGRLQDEDTRAQLADVVAALLAWTDALAAPRTLSA